MVRAYIRNVSIIIPGVHDRSHPRPSPRLFASIYRSHVYRGHLFGGAQGDRRLRHGGRKIRWNTPGSLERMDSRPEIRPFDNVALYIANNRRRPCRKLCSLPPLRMVIWVTHPSVIHFALRVAITHTHTPVSRLINISSRWNEPPWMTMYPVIVKWDLFIINPHIINTM